MDQEASAAQETFTSVGEIPRHLKPYEFALVRFVRVFGHDGVDTWPVFSAVDGLREPEDQFKVCFSGYNSRFPVRLAASG
jgi:hypothetical protein